MVDTINEVEVEVSVLIHSCVLQKFVQITKEIKIPNQS